MDFSWHRRAQDCIAQGNLTNSKRPTALVEGVYPTHVTRGQGAYLFDTDGKQYLDFICGLGTTLVGYSNERVNAAIAQQMRSGASHSLASVTEVLAAEKVKELFPFIDLVKFLKTGTEACSAAVKIARAVTGRDLVLSAGYHGWSDGFVSLTPPAIGVPKGHEASIAKLTSLEQITSDVAAVIVEPVITDWSPFRRSYLQDLRDACTKAGALYIADEVISGFRWPKRSVSHDWGIYPDLICLGKAIANGMPLAVVGGKKHIMNGAEYFVSSSYAGETLSLAAAIATMEVIQKYDFATYWANGTAFLNEFNAMAPDVVTIEGYPSRGVLKGEALPKALFMQEACEAGLLFGPSYFFSFPMSEQWKNLLAPLRMILGRIQRREVTLRGKLPQSPFAQRVRETSQSR